MNFTKLQSLGWSNFFLQQLDFEQLDNPDIQVLRISTIHRDVIKTNIEGYLDLDAPQQE